jgi:hypothetical protein
MGTPLSSGNIKYVDVFSLDCLVEGVEYEVVLRLELPATSELKSQVRLAVLLIPFLAPIPLHKVCALLLLH